MEIHKVERGDTLFGIARTYGIPLGRLEGENGIDDVRELVVGEELVIPDGRPYTVKDGDTLYSVAAEEGTTADALLRANQSLRGIPIIYGGQTLYINEERGMEIIVNGYAYPLEHYRAVILRPYHSGTLNTDSSAFAAFCKRAKEAGIPVYAVNIQSGDTYESSKTFDELGITPLYNTTFAAAYVKLWMQLSK